MKYPFLFSLLIFTLSSCKSGCNITEATALHDTLYVYNYERDSIYLHDSIYNEVTIHGDSIVVLKERWHTAYRDRVKVDTLFHNVTDTVVRTLPPVEIEKKLSWWQELYITLGQISFFLLIAMGIIYLVRLF